jgi:hypothetical protein
VSLGVLESTRPVVETARFVRIDPAAVETLAERLAASPFQRPPWRVAPHWWDDSERTAQYVFVLDALNFCFWGEPKWRVEYRGRSYDGYWAPAACLRRAIEAGTPLLDAGYLAQLDEARTADLLHGEGQLPLLAERAASLRQLGRVLVEQYGGRAVDFVAAAGGGAVALARRVAEELPSFDDVATYDGRAVRFYKRAQILCSDLYGAYEGRGPGAFHDLDKLTAFADYRLPQVLRELGVLVYEPSLAERVDNLVELKAGSPEEVEIRAATIWGVEQLRRALLERAVGIRAFEIDWYLWDLAQRAAFRHPYHRTSTVFY